MNRVRKTELLSPAGSPKQPRYPYVDASGAMDVGLHSLQVRKNELQPETQNNKETHIRGSQPDPSSQEIVEIRISEPNVEIGPLEHGVLGRYLLSGLENKRAANQSSCTYACRWQYKAFLGRDHELGNKADAESKSNCGGCSRANQAKPPLSWMRRLLRFFRSPKILDRPRPCPGVESGIADSEFVIHAKDIRAVQHVEQRATMGLHPLQGQSRTKSPS